MLKQIAADHRPDAGIGSLQFRARNSDNFNGLGLRPQLQLNVKSKGLQDLNLQPSDCTTGTMTFCKLADSFGISI